MGERYYKQPVRTWPKPSLALIAGLAALVVVAAFLLAGTRNQDLTAVTWRTNDHSGVAYYAIVMSNRTDRTYAFTVQSEISLNGKDWEAPNRNSFGGELKPHTNDAGPILILMRPNHQRLAVHSWERTPSGGPLSRLMMWLRSRTRRPLYDTFYLELKEE